jgi:hypothetical protein
MGESSFSPSGTAKRRPPARFGFHVESRLGYVATGLSFQNKNFAPNWKYLESVTLLIGAVAKIFPSRLAKAVSA